MFNPREINLSDPKYLPGEKQVKRNLKAAASTDNAVVTASILKILEMGGNAVDAGIAGCIVQAAIEPFMTNHTGTVTLLYYEAKTGKFYQLDSAGTIPSDLPLHLPIPKQTSGYAMSPPRSCIPGFMPGLKAIHERFGTLEWKILCEEAIYWAETGHHVSSFELEVNMFGESFITFFPEGRQFYKPDGRFIPVGKRFKYPIMAETLRKVAEKGPDYMITGGWGKKFVEKANQMGWKITMDHMVENPPRWIEPLRFPFREYEIVSLAPPQQQGIFVALTLGILDKLDIHSVAPYSADHIYYLAHVMRLAQLNCGYLNDPVISDIDTDLYTDPDYHKQLARLIKGYRPKDDLDLTKHVQFTATPNLANEFIATGAPTREGTNSIQEQPSGSCELSIVDQEGNWVQMMNTLQSGGIPGMVIDGIPMVGSHAMPNMFAAMLDFKMVKGTRMTSVMGHTMVLRDGKPVFSCGTPGNVHCTIPQVLLNYLVFDMSPYEAISAPRMLAMQEDNSVIIEDRISTETQLALEKMGVKVRVSPAWDYHMGSFQICYIDRKTGELCTTADPRRCGVGDGIPR